jgi:hypothetical protein
MPRDSLRSSALVSKRSPSKRARTGTTSIVPAGNSKSGALLARGGGAWTPGRSTTFSIEFTEVLIVARTT